MATAAGSPEAGDTHPWQANIHAKLTRGAGVDVVEEIDYEGNGQFYRRVVPVGSGAAALGAIEVLDHQQLEQLLTELRAEQQLPPPGNDGVGLEVFIDLIEDALETERASHRFDHARFGAVTQDESRGILYGHYGVGIDIVGTIRDMGHRLSVEQHVVLLPPGAYRPMSPADRASLARALTAHPPADRLWQTIRADA